MKSKPAFIRKMSENASVYEQGANKKPFLVIGPATVMYNWVEEFQTWGHFSVGWVEWTLSKTSASQMSV